MSTCRSWVRAIALVPALPAILAVSAAGPCDALCRFEVLSTRRAEPRDSIFASRDPLLRDPANANRVPGPRGLVAAVRTDSLHHPHIFIEDVQRGTSRQLLSEIASEPRWSPDGTRLACTSWKSGSEPWVLTIIDLDGSHLLQPLVGVNVMGFKWSPDGKRIAVTATLPKQPRSVLAVVTLPRQATLSDTLGVLADYEFDWSPDSRTLAVARPTAIDADEEVTASDLWIVDTSGRKCPLVVGPEFAEVTPRWIDGHNLRYTRFRPLDPKRSTEDYVLILASSRSK